MFQAVCYKVNIFGAFQHFKFPGKIIICKVSAFQNVEQLKLDSLNIPGILIIHSSQHIFPGFAGKPENGMNYYFQTSCAESLKGVFKAG